MSVNNFCKSIDWLYTYLEFNYLYEYQIFYLWFYNTLYYQPQDYIYNIFFFSLNEKTSLQLFWSVMLDIYVNSNIFQYSLSDDWSNNFLTRKESTILIVNHPELIFFKNQIYRNFFENFLTDIDPTILNHLQKKSLVSSLLLVPQLISLILLCLIFIIIFFSFFSTLSKEESIIDSDYLYVNSTVESEKEIGSLDDIIMPFICLIFIFGWYFYINSFFLLLFENELVVVWFLMPVLYYTILGIPTMLLFDFGIFFICCIKGVGTTQSILSELLYDCINTISFYTRLLTQGVRLFLMFSIYTSLHDFVIYGNFSKNFFLGVESIWKNDNSINSSLSKLTYSFLFNLPYFLINWLYEIIHTIVIITSQIIAYCAMIFWLFLFLFTFFVLNKHESYFNEKRKKRIFVKINFYKFFIKL